MKTHRKALVTLFAFSIIAQTASAALLTVTNNTGGRVAMTIRYGNAGQYSQQAVLKRNGDSVKFNSGIDRFAEIRWADKNGLWTSFIVSSPTMLTGQIVLQPERGRMLINFDALYAHSKSRVQIAQEIAD